MAEQTSNLEGPLPTLDGISDGRKPSNQLQFPPVTLEALGSFRAAFIRAGPVSGVLDGTHVFCELYFVLFNMDGECAHFSRQSYVCLHGVVWTLLRAASYNSVCLASPFLYVQQT